MLLPEHWEDWKDKVSANKLNMCGYNTHISICIVIYRYITDIDVAANKYTYRYEEIDM